MYCIACYIHYIYEVSSQREDRLRGNNDPGYKKKN